MKIETKLKLTSDECHDIRRHYEASHRRTLDDNQYVNIAVYSCDVSIGPAIEPRAFLVEITPKDPYEFQRSITIIQSNGNLAGNLRYELQPHRETGNTAWERNNCDPDPLPTHVVLSFIDYKVVPNLATHGPDLSALELSIPIT